MQKERETTQTTPDSTDKTTTCLREGRVKSFKGSFFRMFTAVRPESLSVSFAALSWLSALCSKDTEGVPPPVPLLFALRAGRGEVSSPSDVPITQNMANVAQRLQSCRHCLFAIPQLVPGMLLGELQTGPHLFVAHPAPNCMRVRGTVRRTMRTVRRLDLLFFCFLRHLVLTLCAEK